MSEDNVLRIGFSLGSLFDMKEAEEVYNNEGLEAYLEHLNDMGKNDKIFDPGPSLGTYVALRNLNNKIPNNILDIRFGIVSKNSMTNETANVFRNTYRKLISDIYPHSDFSVDFDYLSFTNGRMTVEALHKMQKTDLSFSTSKKSAELIYEKGIPSIYIPNISKGINKKRYDKKDGDFILVADYDGVIGDVNSELVYQKAKKMRDDYGIDINPIEEFRKSEREKRDQPMELGPMGKVIQKFCEADTYLRKGSIRNDKLPFEMVVVTARGVAAVDRYIATLQEYNIEAAQLHMMDGTNKNNALEALAEYYHSENLLFIDDGEIHFNRSLELDDVVSGLVMNDFNTGKVKVELDNEDHLKIKDFLSRKQESINEEKNNSENKVRLRTTRIKP